MIPQTDPAGAPAAHPARPDACLNCATPAPGHFCPACGQATHEHVPSATEFLHEFVGHYVALEGKLWGTLGRLLFRPGALTNEYIAGRRVRYVEPLRVYLTMSILFFALIKLPGFHTDAPEPGGGHATASVKEQVDQSINAAQQAADAAKASAPASAAAQARDAAKVKPAAAPSSASASAATFGKAVDGVKVVTADTGNVVKLDDEDESTLMDYLDVHAKPIAKRIRHVATLPHEEQRKLLVEGFSHYAPYAMFCLMPLFALYLKVLYLGSGRRYGEHFLFALHTNAFAFLMFAVIELAPEGFARFVLMLWLIGYLPWAMKRVYRRSRMGTLGRWLLLSIAHVLTIMLALLGVTAYAMLH